jgi:hypothetical protein
VVKIVVVDVGSHKLEELNVLFSPSFAEFKLLVKETFKYLLFRSKYQLKILIRAWLILLNRPLINARKYTDIIVLEPNVNVSFNFVSRLKKIMRLHHFPICILGHDYEQKATIVNLNLYENTLSASVYDKSKFHKAGHLKCLGVDFYEFMSLCIKENVMSLNDEVVIRMNCEGAELGVVKGVTRLIDEGFSINCILGSLADVRKIHGEGAYSEMLFELETKGVEHFYFKGSDISTWAVGIGAFRAVMQRGRQANE